MAIAQLRRPRIGRTSWRAISRSRLPPGQGFFPGLPVVPARFLVFNGFTQQTLHHIGPSQPLPNQQQQRQAPGPATAIRSQKPRRILLHGACSSRHWRSALQTGSTSNQKLRKQLARAKTRAIAGGPGEKPRLTVSCSKLLERPLLGRYRDRPQPRAWVNPITPPITGLKLGSSGFHRGSRRLPGRNSPVHPASAHARSHPRNRAEPTDPH